MRSFDRQIWATHFSREWPAFAIVTTLVTGMICYDAWIRSGKTVAENLLTGSIERISLNTATWDDLQVVLTIRLPDGRMVTILDSHFAASNCHLDDAVDVNLSTKSNGHQVFSMMPRSCRSK